MLSMYFHYFFIISPLEKGGALHLDKLKSPTTKDALCQVVFFLKFFPHISIVPSLVEFSPVVLEEEMKM